MDHLAGYNANQNGKKKQTTTLGCVCIFKSSVFIDTLFVMTKTQ